MSCAEDLLGRTLLERYRLESVVTEHAEFLVYAGVDVPKNAPVTVRMARALRGMSAEEVAASFDKFAIEAEQLAQITKGSEHAEQLLASGEDEAPDRERLAYCIFARTDG